MMDEGGWEQEAQSNRMCYSIIETCAKTLRTHSSSQGIFPAKDRMLFINRQSILSKM